MKLNILVFVFALMACSPVLGTDVDQPWKNGRLKISDNHRYLEFENGKPFFWLGDTGWLLPERLDRAEAQYYLQKCRRAGYNMVQVQVLDDVPSVNITGNCLTLQDGTCQKLIRMVFIPIGIILIIL